MNNPTLNLSITDGEHLVAVVNAISRDCRIPIETVDNASPDPKIALAQRFIQEIQAIANLEQDRRQVFVEALGAWATDEQWPHIVFVFEEIGKQMPDYLRYVRETTIAREDEGWRRTVIAGTIMDTDIETRSGYTQIGHNDRIN